MADVHSIETRSKNMRAIRAKNTKPELSLRKLLHKQGFRFRLHSKKLPGTPDIVLPKYKAAIFVNGCFWHGHDCHLFKVPQTNTKMWLTKIDSNKNRDARKIQELLSLGWRVLVVWECALKGKEKLSEERVVETLEEWICSGHNSASLDVHGLKAF